MNLAWIKTIPVVTKKDFGSPWAIPFHHGDTKHLEKPQGQEYHVDYQAADGRPVNTGLWS